MMVQVGKGVFQAYQAKPARDFVADETAAHLFARRRPQFITSSDEADGLVASTDPLHVRLLHGTRTDLMHSPRVSFQSCVPAQAFLRVSLGGSSSISHMIRYPLRCSSSVQCRQGLHRPIRRSKGTDRTLTHLRPALPTSHSLMDRLRLSSSSETKAQRVGVYALLFLMRSIRGTPAVSFIPIGRVR